MCLNFLKVQFFQAIWFQISTCTPYTAGALKAADEQADVAADDKSLSRAQKSQFFQEAGDRADDFRAAEAAAQQARLHETEAETDAKAAESASIATEQRIEELTKALEEADAMRAKMADEGFAALVKAREAAEAAANEVRDGAS